MCTSSPYLLHSGRQGRPSAVPAATSSSELLSSQSGISFDGGISTARLKDVCGKQRVFHHNPYPVLYSTVPQYHRYNSSSRSVRVCVWFLCAGYGPGGPPLPGLIHTLRHDEAGHRGQHPPSRLMAPRHSTSREEARLSTTRVSPPTYCWRYRYVHGVGMPCAVQAARQLTSAVRADERDARLQPLLRCYQKIKSTN
jgi:hypothetical protein